MAKLTAEIISSDLLKEQSGPEIFSRGQKLFREKKVVVEKVLDDAARCRVLDTSYRQVTINLTDQYLYLKCDCPYAAKGNICEHDVAAALAVQDYFKRNNDYKWQTQLTRLLQIQSVTRRENNHPYFLFFSLQNVSNPGFINWKIVPYFLPIIGLPKEIRSQIEFLKDDEINSFFKNNPRILAYLKTPYQELVPENCINCSSENVILTNLMVERSKNYGSGQPPLFEYLSLLSSFSSPLYIGTGVEPLQKPIMFIDPPADLRLQLEKDPNGIIMNTCIEASGHVFKLAEEEIELISLDPFLILIGNMIVRIDDPDQTEYIKALAPNPLVYINDHEINEFLSDYYLRIANRIQLLGDIVTWETYEQAPIPRIYLIEKRNEIQAQVKFCYGENEIDYDPSFPDIKVLKELDSWRLIKVIRNPILEEEYIRILSSKRFGLKRAPSPSKPGLFVLRSRIHPADFLIHTVPLLIKEGFEVFGEEKLKDNRVNRNKPEINFQVSSGIDWFDVKVSIQFGETFLSFKEFRKAIKRRERFVKLSDGKIGEIPEEWLEKYKHLFNLADEIPEGIRLQKFHISLIDQVITEVSDKNENLDLVSQLERIKNISDSKSIDLATHELPIEFSGNLRPYQVYGYNWLHFLHAEKMGGCLADDMGLGKTIQALVFFQSLYKEDPGIKKPSLIVVPKSLLANWQREANRFVPKMKIFEYFNSNRPKDLGVFDSFHLVITTYGILLRDIQLLRHYPFYFVLMDESQIIKNPASQTSRAARSLTTSHRLVLTGTPVENSTIELWSQFSFLNPGLLGNLEYFKREFSTPIEKKGDEEATQLLRKLVSPFILRRTKEQVAKELPPRSERVLFCDMEPSQRKLYNQTKELYRGMILGLFESEGFNNSKMKILEGLLRLRQICNHPKLAAKNFRGESGKVILLLETLETLRMEGHKALVFSQFVQMLSIIRNILDKNNVPYRYLDGKTQNRQDIVDEFQSNSAIPFFLISLRAGGLGLNLTAADYVLHIDPWWNPAVEMQASDRSHRIGQENPVFIYKFITRDSVEEKIMQLQERKQELVDQIITTDEGFFRNLTKDEVDDIFN